MLMGEVVIDVHGIEIAIEEQKADETLTRDASLLDCEDAGDDSKNRDESVSSLNSRLFKVILEPWEEVDNCSGVKFLKNLYKLNNDNEINAINNETYLDRCFKI